MGKQAAATGFPFNNPSMPFSQTWLKNFRKPDKRECDALISNGNTAASWDTVLVENGFDPARVHSCNFYGTCYISAIDDGTLSHGELILPLGLYNSTFVDCCISPSVAIHNLSYCSRCYIGPEVLIYNTSEITNAPGAVFGNGLQMGKSGDSARGWINVINENGKRAILPFEGIRPVDAYLWAKYRSEPELLKQFIALTDATCAKQSNSYGVISSGARIINTRILRDVKVGEKAVVDGAERIRNATVRSTGTAPSFIGAAVMIDNAITGYSNAIDSGAHLSGVITGEMVAIDKNAQLYDSVISDNSHISCCEIGCSFISPSHQQHHNNSFLIASMIGGQSNVAAGATIGSNHNSRTNDGEIWANRGFWPGLCTSFKHNSRFASFVLAVKADYPSELDIPFPFSLISNDTVENCLVVHPAYLFTGNLYAFMRNNSKFIKRDERRIREHHIENDCLAPDTISELLSALTRLELYTGKAWLHEKGENTDQDTRCREKGHELLSTGISHSDTIDLAGSQMEKGHRHTRLKNIPHAWKAYRTMAYYYCVKTLRPWFEKGGSPLKLLDIRKKPYRKWINCGGQILAVEQIEMIVDKISRDRSLKTWDDVHALLDDYARNYPNEKELHALYTFSELEGVEYQTLTEEHIEVLLEKGKTAADWLIKGVKNSRERDFSDPFRKLPYDSPEEMNAVLGTFDRDPVIKAVNEEMKSLVKILQQYKPD